MFKANSTVHDMRTSIHTRSCSRAPAHNATCREADAQPRAHRRHLDGWASCILFHQRRAAWVAQHCQNHHGCLARATKRSLGQQLTAGLHCTQYQAKPTKSQRKSRSLPTDVAHSVMVG